MLLNAMTNEAVVFIDVSQHPLHIENKWQNNLVKDQYYRLL